MIDLRLSLSRLRKQLHNNKVSFFLIIISAIISILSFSNLYFKYIPTFNDQRKNNDSYRFYDYMFYESISTSNIEKIFNTLPELDKLLVSNVDLSMSTFEESEDIYNEFISAFYEKTDYIDEVELQGSDLETYSDLKDNEVLLPNYYQANFSDEYIDYNGIKLKVKGYWNGLDLLVNYETFSNHFDAMQIVFKTHELLDEKNLIEVDSFMQTFPIQSIRTPYEVYQRDKTNTYTVMLFINTIYILSVVSYSILLNYIVRSFENELRVYRNIGMSKLRILLGLIFDLLIIISISAIIAILIQEVFWNSFFSKLLEFELRRISVNEYIVFYIIVIIFSFIIICPSIYNSFNKILKNRKAIDWWNYYICTIKEI